MVGKEIRSASWKFGLVALLVLVALTQNPTPYETIVEYADIEREFMQEELERMRERGLSEREIEEMYGPSISPEDRSLEELSRAYVSDGATAMVLLAGLLGVGLVSSEVGGGTILALLSRPVSRTRLFLTKYIVCAAFLLAASVFGAVALFSVAWLRDYPFGEITWAGVVLAVFLMWLVSLFILGTALLVSTLTRNAMQSLIGTAVVVFLLLTFPTLIITFADIFLWNDLYYEDGFGQFGRLYEVVQILTLNNYWPDPGYFWPGGEDYMLGPYPLSDGSKILDFVVCFFAAVIPLLTSLWLFDRKKF